MVELAVRHSWVAGTPDDDIDHSHLTYADANVTISLNPDDEHGTLLGEMAQGADQCSPSTR